MYCYFMGHVVTIGTIESRFTKVRKYYIYILYI